MASTDITNLAVNSQGPGHLRLTWQNPSPNPYSFIEIRRALTGGSFSIIDELYKGQTQFDDYCEDGVAYDYEVQGWMAEPEQWYNTVSESNSFTPLHAPAVLTGECIDPDSVILYWNDQTNHESGFKIHKGGAYLSTVGQNVEQSQIDSLTPGSWIKFKVKAYNAITESAFSNEIDVFTYDPPNAPSDLQAVPTSVSQIDLSWKDNSTNELDFHIEESSTGPSSGFSEIATVGAGENTYQRTGRSGGTQYWYRVRAHNSSDYSAYCSVATAVTLGDFAKPTGVTLLSVKGTEVEIIFQDNSNDEDYHSIERKIGGGSYSEIKQLEPNRQYYRDASGISAGNVVYYKIRAKQGVAYSAYSDEVSITTPSTSGTPTGLTLGSKKDTWQRLTWAATAGAQGYVIYRSTNGSSYTAYLTIQRPDVTALKMIGLTPNTRYWWKIASYNGNGESSQSSAVDGWTDQYFTDSKLEIYSRKTNLNLIILAEINPKMELSGFTLTGGRTYTYEIVFQERGAEINEVWENGVAYVAKATITDVESTASSFYFDFWNRKLYIHTSTGGNPVNVQIDAGFWLYFTNTKSVAFPCDFNDRNYLPMISRQNIPDVNQEVQPFFSGNLSMSSGTIGMMNSKVGGEYYFDKRFRRYKWENRKVVLKAGGQGFAYAEYQTILTGVISGKQITDTAVQFDITDYREGVNRSVPVSEYWTSEYPNLDDSTRGMKKAFGYGTITQAVAVCVDSVRKKWAFHNGRVKSVQSVKVNGGSALTENTNFFIDYVRGVIEFAEAFTIETTDIVSISFHGAMESNGNEEITDGGEVLIDFCVRFLNLKVADLDLDSIYWVKKSLARNLSGYMMEEKSSNEILKTIEQTLFAYTRQNEDGRIGLKMVETTAPTNARRIKDGQIKKSPSVATDRDSYIKNVYVYYGENGYAKSWERVIRTKESMGYSYGIGTDLRVFTWASTLADAQSIGNAFLTMLEKDKAEVVTTPHLFASLAGDTIVITRSRWPNASGGVDETPFLILKVTKSPSRNETILTVEATG